MLYEKLNYIIAIAEEQNLTRAAKRLFISQPTLTLYLNRLEKELGVKLFNRSKSPVSLTNAGTYYLEEMKKIYASEQALRSDIQFIDNPSQTLVVGIGQVRGHYWLPLILPTFSCIHPTINIQVVQGAEHIMYQELKKNHLDVVIGALPVTSDVATVELMQEHLIFAAHQKFGLIPPQLRDKYSYKNPYLIQPEQIDGLPFITPRVNNGLYDCYESILLNNRIHPSRTISFNNLTTGLLLNVKGLGIQLLSSPLLQFNQDPGVKNLDFFRVELMPETRKCVAVFKNDNIKIKLITDFIRTIQNEIVSHQ